MLRDRSMIMGGRIAVSFSRSRLTVLNKRKTILNKLDGTKIIPGYVYHLSTVIMRKEKV